MHPRLSLFSLLAFVIAAVFSTSLHAQTDPVSVVRVKFNNNYGNWKDTQYEVELVANANPNPQAPNSKYVDNVKVTFTVGYRHPRSDSNFIFHTSSVTIASLEIADSKKIGFYLPYIIVERDGLRKEPEFWFVNLEVDGAEIPVTTGNIGNRASRSIQDPTALRSFQNQASNATEGILLPGYLSGNGYVERGDDRPAFIRIEEN